MYLHVEGLCVMMLLRVRGQRSQRVPPAGAHGAIRDLSVTQKSSVSLVTEHQRGDVELFKPSKLDQQQQKPHGSGC